MFNILARRLISIALVRLPTLRLTPSEGWLYKTAFSVFVCLYEEILAITQYFPLVEIELIQKRRLLHLMSTAKRCVPFYQRYLRDINSFKDFISLPAISKELMRTEADRGTLVNQVLRGFKIERSTSGSTGIPLHFYLDRNMLPKRLAVYRRMLSWAGRQKSDFVVRLMGREHPGTESEGLWFKCENLEDLEEKRFQLYIYLEGKVVLLQSWASFVVRLAQLMEQDGKLFRFRAIISYAEQLYPETRSYLEKAFRAPVYNYYANEELTAIAQECPFKQGLHVNSEWVYPEIVDDHNQILSPGSTGNLIVTGLDNEVMPFIKYNTGDQGYWIREPCPCGRTLPRINMEGRESNSFLLPDNRVGYLFNIIKPILLLVHKIFQYHVTRRKMDDFLVQIVPLQSFNEEDEKFILSNILEYLGPQVGVTIEIVQEIQKLPGRKQRVFVNLVPQFF